MDTRAQIAHLLRRFGLGARRSELNLYEPLGVEGTIDRLLNFEKVEPNFDISLWELCFEPESDLVYLDPIRAASHWALRCLMTNRPLEEKLTLFWHDHFAVSAEKVEFGPAMHSYIGALRDNCVGPFNELTKAVSKEPAMIRFLDTDTSFKGVPNENFGRELLELFTMGIGTYTEADVKEVSRAFTGWGNRYVIYEAGGEEAQNRAKEAIRNELPMIAYAFSPELHDGSPKTVLGQTGSFGGNEVIDMLCARPETARHVAGKLWSFFAYPDPEPAVVERLAKIYTGSGMSIKAVLREIAKSPEFWSEKCVRQRVKSPFEFLVPLLRQFELDEILAQLRGKPASKTTPLPKPLRDTAGLIVGSLYKQGMLLLYPPDVDGWQWGASWISTNNMLERTNLSNVLFLTDGDTGAKPLSNFLALKIVRDFNPTQPEDVANAILAIFDADLPPEKRKLLAETCAKHGGAAALKEPGSATKLLAPVCTLLFASPEFQFC